MNITEIRDKVLFSKEYEFLKTNEHLGNNIILIGLGGSYAYGTNKEDGSSDLDVRGCTLNTKFLQIKILINLLMMKQIQLFILLINLFLY